MRQTSSTRQRTEGMTGALTEARRRRDEVRLAAEALERTVATAAGSRPSEWAAEVRARLDSLERAFSDHIEATEGPEGLFREVTATAPRLQHRIDQLRGDHAELRDLLASLSARSDSVVEADLEALRQDIVRLLGRITWHRHLGAELVYEAYTVDIEAGD